jgi:arylsulfatase A-like enzyme
MKGTRRGPVVLREPRYITMVLPLHERRVISKIVSLYDIAPTIMDLAGIEYSPKFVFGSSVFSSNTGLVPSRMHLQFIYKYFSDDMRWSLDLRCGEHFCN